MAQSGKQSGKQSGPPGKQPGQASGKPPAKQPGKPAPPSGNPSQTPWLKSGRLKSGVKSVQAMPAPLRTLLLIATIATSIGLWAGMLLRWTQPNLLSTVSLFQGVQSFPDANWPGSEVPQPTADLPAPEAESTTPPFIGSPTDDPQTDRLPEVGDQPIMSPDVGSDPGYDPGPAPGPDPAPVYDSPDQAAPEPAPDYQPEPEPDPAPPIEEAPPPPPDAPLEAPTAETANP